MGFEPTCPGGQLDFESSSLRPLRYVSMFLQHLFYTIFWLLLQGDITMRYNSLNSYLKEKFGCKIYKLALSGGLSCPNRDGTISTGGCIFCSNGGSGDFAADKMLSITEQIESAKNRVSLILMGILIILEVSSRKLLITRILWLFPLAPDLIAVLMKF